MYIRSMSKILGYGLGRIHKICECQYSMSTEMLGGGHCVGGEDLPQPLAAFPTVFPTDFLEKLARKVVNGNHVIAGCYNWLCQLVAKHPDCDYVIMDVLGCQT